MRRVLYYAFKAELSFKIERTQLANESECFFFSFLMTTKGQRSASKQCIKDNKLKDIDVLFCNSRRNYFNEDRPLFNVVFRDHCVPGASSELALI